MIIVEGIPIINLKGYSKFHIPGYEIADVFIQPSTFKYLVYFENPDRDNVKKILDWCYLNLNYPYSYCPQFLTTSFGLCITNDDDLMVIRLRW